MEEKKGPLYGYLASGLIVAAAHLDVVCGSTSVLQPSERPSITPTGHIIFRGVQFSSIGKLCEVIFGKKVGSVRKRVRYEEQSLDDIHKNFTAKKSRPILPPAPATEPADFAIWRQALAELIQMRFTPHMSGKPFLYFINIICFCVSC